MPGEDDDDSSSSSSLSSLSDLRKKLLPLSSEGTSPSLSAAAQVQSQPEDGSNLSMFVEVDALRDTQTTIDDNNDIRPSTLAETRQPAQLSNVIRPATFIQDTVKNDTFTSKTKLTFPDNLTETDPSSTHAHLSWLPNGKHSSLNDTQLIVTIDNSQPIPSIVIPRPETPTKGILHTVTAGTSRPISPSHVTWPDFTCFLGKGGAEDEDGYESDLPEQVDPDRCYSWLLPSTPSSQSKSHTSVGSSSSSSSSSTSSIPVPPPPDGGWGWLVVLGAFIISLFCDGLAYCFGVLYSELLVQFGQSKGKTSMVGSIFFGVAMILGPCASALTTRFGCRAMTIVGGLLSALGLFLSCFAHSIEMLCITFSVVVGVGFSFCYITSVVIVAFYFDKRRALATGMAVCGTGVGTFTFAPLMDFLITEYGWRGLFLIMSGLSLNLVVCGMLFRPLQFTRAQRCQMLLDEFNKLSPGRENLETARGGRYSSSADSDSSSTSSSSASETVGESCWGGWKRGGPSSSSEDESEDESESSNKHPKRSVSMLSLPTFVRRSPLASQLSQPSTALMNALRASRNPHLTVQRYMKNAFLQFEAAKMAARRSRRHKSERGNDSTPVDPDALRALVNAAVLKDKRSQKVEKPTSDVLSPLLQPVHSPLVQAKVSPVSNRRHQSLQAKAIDTRDVAMAVSPPVHRASGLLIPNPLQSADQPSSRRPSKHSLKNGHSSHLSSGLLSAGQDTPKKLSTQMILIDSSTTSKTPAQLHSGDGSKRLSGFYVGRHNALSIHLPLYRSDIFYRRTTGYPHYRQLPCTLGTSCPELADSSTGAERNLSRSRMQFLCSRFSAFMEDAGGVFRSMLEFRLFLNPFFMLFVVSNFIYYFWSDVPYMYAKDHALDLGMDTTSASFQISIIGIFNTLGQVIFGYIGDQNVNLLNVYAVVSALSGVAVGLVPLMQNYPAIATVYAIFGFCGSVSFPLTTVLLVNNVGINRLTNAYGLLMLMQGIANLFGPPFAGWTSDITGTYDATFYMSGVFTVLSGVILFLAYLPACKKDTASGASYSRSSIDSREETGKESPSVTITRLREEGSPV